MINRSPARKAISPAALILTLLCLLLPFLTVSCDTGISSVTAEFTGWDLVVGGEPTVTTSGGLGAALADRQKATAPAQPLMIAVVVVILAGVVGGGVLAFVRSRLWPWAGLLTGLVAALLVLINQTSMRGKLIEELQRDTVMSAASADAAIQSRFGYPLTLLLLVVVAGYNVVELVLGSRRRPSQAQQPPDGSG